MFKNVIVINVGFITSLYFGDLKLLFLMYCFIVLVLSVIFILLLILQKMWIL